MTLSVAARVARKFVFLESTNITTDSVVMLMTVSVMHLCKTDGRRSLSDECSAHFENETERSWYTRATRITPLHLITEDCVVLDDPHVIRDLMSSSSIYVPHPLARVSPH